LGFEVKKEDAAGPKWLRSSPVLLDEFGDEKNSPIYIKDWLVVWNICYFPEYMGLYY
jgi:hypothetical protein